MASDQQFTIPKVLLEGFATQPRIVFKPIPGIWPVDIKLLRNGWLEKMAADKEFARNCDVVIMPKGEIRPGR